MLTVADLETIPLSFDEKVGYLMALVLGNSASMPKTTRTTERLKQLRDQIKQELTARQSTILHETAQRQEPAPASVQVRQQKSKQPARTAAELRGFIAKVAAQVETDPKAMVKLERLLRALAKAERKDKENNRIQAANV